MRPALVPLLLALAALAVAGCKTVEVRPTGAGSTAVLRLMRDWRGVWSGAVRESPMGAFTYTLYVEKKEDHLLLSSARIREAGLDSIKHEYRLYRFDKGMPRIEYSLSQKGGTVEGRLAYQEDASDEDQAVFCPEESSCDKLKLVFTKVGEKEMSFKTMVDEAPHSEFTLAFVSRDIPKDHGEWLDKPAPGTPIGGEATNAPKAKVKVDADGNPLDQDVVLQEHVDDDLGTVKKAPKKDEGASKKDQKKKSGDDEEW